ncbi:putative ATPase [Knufia obscura]|uniref:ATPase n=2 Tax=Knufia TaxID=430999 RepID=A0AAN8ETN8_9EURO|nr:putative ATPase [Knufia obscura]KAK5958688.1 putative ATPase [Knufia fluminis]
MATADVAVPTDVNMKDADEADMEDRKNAAANEEEDEEEDMDLKSKALTNLLKTSSVFVAIMADKMKEQQKQNAERAKREATRKQNAERKASEAKGSSRRSARTHQEGETNGEVKEERTKQEEDEQPARKGRGRPKRDGTSVAKDKKGSITSYLDKKQLKEAEEGPSVQKALAEAAGEIEEKGEGLGAQDLVATEQPKLVSGGKMREYQLEGLEWLKTLWMNGLCGILADEMGLGKTVQAISLIAFFKENNISGPFLVAAPLSTVRNWVEEFKRWTPEINTVLYHGSKPEREEIRKKHMKMQQQGKFEFPVVITSYEICMNDKNFLANYKWRYIVVDEGHRLKNMNCKLIKELMTYNSANRLLITGTPLQNNIAELWSLLHFLLPEVFNDLDSFERWFDFSSVLDDKDSDTKSSKRKNNLVSTMHAILKPFLLRRVKTDVESTLPPKREYILYAPLTNEQKDIYKEILAGTARTYLEDKAVERIEARSRTASLKRKANDSRHSTPVKATKTSRATTPATNASRADTPGSTASTGSTRRGRKAARRNYEEIGDREFNSRLRQVEKGQDADLNGNNPSSSEIDSEEEASQERSKTLKLAKQEIASKKLQNPVMQARLACNSPHNFYWPFSSGDPDADGDLDLPPLDETLVTASGKLLLLDTLLPNLLSGNHKILIFSQFKTTLDILETYCDTLREWPVCRIDGSISQDDRYEQITSFNSPKSEHKIFLLSTRAGGQGINLAAADTVILFDSDWNPQQDLQAMDRAHRIGQTRPVIVYRFATRGTVEETLLLKADSKRRLEKLVIQKGKFKSLIDGVDSKSRKPKPGEIDVKDFRSALGETDGEGYEFEKYEISELEAEKGGKLLTDEELDILTDRRPEAYEKVAKGENVGGEGQVWKVAETKSDGLEELTTRKNPKQ